MKSRPISFSVHLVQPIVDGTKTVTRRPLLVQPEPGTVFVNHEHGRWFKASARERLQAPWEKGDVLWVREQIGQSRKGDVVYKADYPHGKMPIGYRWVAARFMPKVHARIWLLVESVSCERLQLITARDAYKEGVPKLDVVLDEEREITEHFAGLWNRIYGRHQGKRWDDNPWVWRMEFSLHHVSGGQG